jgi:tetratricopeptide (TPR) repeat protein
MKKIIFTSFLLIQTLLINAQEKIQIRTTSASPASTFDQEVGSAKIKIAYSRPLVRGRKIFGELVPFDKLWRTGASDCTAITTSEDIYFGNSILKSGSYSIFSIPSVGEWIIIVNTDITLHGETGYDEKKDVMRFKVPTEKSPYFYETFTIELNDINSKGEAFLKIFWENTMVKIPIKSKEDDTLLALIDQHIVKGKTQDANLLFQAANFYYSTNRDFKQAIKWLLEAEKLNPQNFYYPNLRQKIASENKDYASAIEAAKRAVSLADKEKMKKNIETLNNKIASWELLLKK